MYNFSLISNRIMDEDISLYLEMLFLEDKFDKYYGVIFPFTTSKNNDGILVNNYTYYRRKGTNRYICNFEKCSASITTDGNEDDPKIIKANGKKISECLVPYRFYHNHEPMSNEQCTQVLSLERIKARVLTENVPISKIYDEELISLAKNGMSTKFIATAIPFFCRFTLFECF